MVSSHGLLELHSSDELTGGFFTTCGELEYGGPTSLAVLFLRRGFSGTCTCSTCDTRFCVLAEGGAERRVTGATSDLVERLSLKFLDKVL